MFVHFTQVNGVFAGMGQRERRSANNALDDQLVFYWLLHAGCGGLQ